MSTLVILTLVISFNTIKLKNNVVTTVIDYALSNDTKTTEAETMANNGKVKVYDQSVKSKVR